MTPTEMASTNVGTVQGRIHGDISGQVAVGNNILQNNVSHGGVVYVAAPGQAPTVQRRPSPVQLAGRPEPPLLGRDAELGEVASALERAEIVQICGTAGSGKTALLKSVVHGVPGNAGADGVVYHNALAEPVEDTMQSIFEAFYASDVPFKPSDVEIRHALQPIRALVALDDVTQSSDRMRRAIDAAPNAAFLLASPRPVLAGTGPSLSLRGLAEEPALGLLERGLGRALTARERPAARAIVRALEGQPLRLVQVTGVVRELNGSLPALARDLRSGDAVEALAERIFSSLGDDQRDVLALLAAMDQAPLYVDNLAELTGITDVGPVVESLLLLALVQAHSPRFSLTADLGEERRRDLDSERWRDRILHSLPDWVERQSDPASVVSEAPAILQALEDGVARRAWPKVLRLARTVETALILGRRWGTWEAVLHHELQAARSLSDRAAEGWSLHQLGTRALCLGDTFTARTHLSEALRIRESLHDTDGAAATRHNLELLSGPPPPPRPPEEPPPKPSGGRPPMLAGAAAVIVLLLGLAMVSLRSSSDGERPITSVDLVGGELSADELHFGEQRVGTTSDVLGARLANSAGEPVVVDAVTLTGASPGDFVVGDDPCTGTSIAPGAACTVGVLFRPTAIGARHATLTISRGGGTLAVVLRGNGTSAAVDTTIEAPGTGATFVLAADPSRLTLDNQPLGTASSPTTVTVRNQGTAPVLLDRVVVTGADRGDFLLGDDNCVGRTLSPGARCSTTVTFRPTETGARSAALEVGPAGGPPLLVALQGTGAPSADLSVELEIEAVPFQLGAMERDVVVITVANGGPSSVPTAVLTVSGDATVYMLEGDGMDCPPIEDADVALGKRRCTVSELRPGQVAQLTLDVCGGVYARVTADVTDPNEENNDGDGSVPCAVGDVGLVEQQ